MAAVMISSERAHDSIVEALIEDSEVGGSSITRDRITGGAELTTALITLTPVVLTAIVRILRAKWDKDSKVTIEAKGVKMQGVSPDDAEMILRRVLADEKRTS
jgi:hypothetical protein